jgi:hypothetical protein
MLYPERIRNEFISAEGFMDCSNQVWSTDRRLYRRTEQSVPQHKSILYAKRDHVSPLFDKLKKTRNRVVLVSSESDDAVEPVHHFPEQVAAWFSTNNTHPEVVSIPLGLGNSYCLVTSKADMIAEFAQKEKRSLLYVNFRPETNPEVRMPLWQRFNSLEWEGYCTRQPGNVSPEEYIASMATHRFVLCPRGNGIDTHRMWEALYLGSIPIVERHSALDAFSDLPILFVNHLGSITRQELEYKFREIQETTWNMEKLFMTWWQSRIERQIQSIQKRVSWSNYVTQKLVGIRR